jgi:hypothetical protein
MKDFWELYSSALDGLFGRQVKRTSGVCLGAVGLIGVAWAAPERWLLHSYFNWQHARMMELLAPMWNLIQHQIKHGTSIHH